MTAVMMILAKLQHYHYQQHHEGGFVVVPMDGDDTMVLNTHTHTHFYISFPTPPVIII